MQFAMLCVGLWMAAPDPAAELPTRADIIKRGKASTVLVEQSDTRVRATAFCVGDDLFVTSAGALRGSHEQVRIVVNVGLPTERTFQGRLVRVHPERDLALIQTEKGAGIPALPLGVDRLEELASLIAFGFPIDKATPDRRDYPSVSVHAGAVVSLRRKAADLEFVEMDLTLNPGLSGGPVLDVRGEVVGLVVSSVADAQVNRAVPVGRLRSFLAPPIIDVTLPTLDPASERKEASFQATVRDLFPATGPVTVELVLADGKRERRLPMKEEKGRWRVLAVPRDKPSARVRLKAQFEDAVVDVLADDVAVSVGDANLLLSEIVEVRAGTPTTVKRRQGEPSVGVVRGLEAVPVSIGDSRVTLDLTRASEVRLEALPVDPVRVSVVVRHAGKEVGRTGVVLGGRGQSVVAPAMRTAMLDGKLEYDLPSKVEDVVAGGGGRYLVLHAPTERKLHVFDVARASITHSIPAAEDRLFYGVSRDKVVVVLPATGLVQRYNLATGQREKTHPFRPAGKVVGLALGADSDGPIYLGGPSGPGDKHNLGLTLLDLTTLEPISVRQMDKHAYSFEQALMRASADGRVMAMTNHRGHPQVFERHGADLRLRASEEGVGLTLPGPDGQFVFGQHTVWPTRAAKPGRGHGSYCLIPAHSGALHLSLHFSGRGYNVPFGVVAPDDEQACAAFDIGELFGNWYPYDMNGLTRDKRVHLCPKADALVMLAQTNDRLVLHRFDLQAMLEKSGRGYLVVTSRCPRVVRRSESLSYRIEVLSRRGRLQFELLSGPEGMAVSSAGEVTWKVPDKFTATEVEAIVSVSDADGLQRLHRIRVDVEE